MDVFSFQFLNIVREGCIFVEQNRSIVNTEKKGNMEMSGEGRPTIAEHGPPEASVKSCRTVSDIINRHHRKQKQT